jgi:hypothetical protein
MDKTLMQAFTFAGITKREGQQLPDYAKEIKALTPEDRQWFAERFKVEFGITIIESPKA